MARRTQEQRRRRASALALVALGLLSPMVVMGEKVKTTRPPVMVVPLKAKHVPLPDHGQLPHSHSRSLAGEPHVEDLAKLNPNLMAYFATVQYEPNQVVDVLIDTGSAGLGVPVANFMPDWKDFEHVDLSRMPYSRTVPCDDARCRGRCDQPDADHFCGPNGGSCIKYNGQDACSFSWRYGDGSRASGVLIEAPIELGGVKVNSTFGGIISATSDFFEAPKGGGIMGMSFGNYRLCDSEFTCFRPLMDDLTSLGNLEDTFSICASKSDAKLIIGGGDERLHQGPVQHVPFVEPYGFYWVNLQAVKLGGQDILINRPSRYSMRGRTLADNPIAGRNIAMIDTGNSALFLPRPVFARFKEVMLSTVPEMNQRHPNIFEEKAVQMDEDVVSKMPDLTFYLDNNVTITLTNREYLLHFINPEVEPKTTLTYLRLHASEKYVFGQTVLNHLYLEFDRANKQLGIAPSVPGCKLPNQ